MLRHIDVELKSRVETGPTQIGDDWPGLFIRGDNAMNYAAHLQALLEGKENWATRHVLEGLLSDLMSCHVRRQ